ncbi:MAG: hypothetical protein HQM13_20815 [SAR324 cluster bacterium]|nr:hypothetical protein [SAR324 cluster bacterium]
MGNTNTEVIRHICKKYKLNPGETAYFEKMLALMGEDEYWEEYAASIKLMGMAQLEWVEPDNFAASVKIEAERKAQIDKKPEHLVESFKLNEKEQAYLIKMIESSEDSDYAESYAESIKSMGIEDLQWLEPEDFAASVRLEEERKTETLVEAVPETREQREARKSREAKGKIKKLQSLHYGTDIILNADEFIEKNQLLLQEKEEKPKQIVSIKFQRQRTGGVSQSQGRIDFDKTLAELIRYDVMLEITNETIEKEKAVLLRSYPEVNELINQLFQETTGNGGDTPEANQIKEKIRLLINNQRLELNFVRLFRNVADPVAESKKIVEKAEKLRKATDKKAKELDIFDELNFLYNTKKPAIKAAVLKKPFTY